MRFMEMIAKLDEVTDGNGLLSFVAILCGFLLLLSVTVACLCKKESVYVATAFLSIAAMEYAIYVTETPLETVVQVWGITWVAVGGGWIFTLLTIFFLNRALHKKKRLIVSAKVNALLPERDNSYVRARLNTALRTEEISAEQRKRVPYENRGTVRLGYVRRLLASIQDAPLPPAERLEVETLSQEVENYARCEKWNATQLRAVNELFARLLKLAAKYSVEE